MLSVRVDTCTQTVMTEKQDLRSRLVVGTRSFNDAPQRLRPADILQGMRSA